MKGMGKPRESSTPPIFTRLENESESGIRRKCHLCQSDLLTVWFPLFTSFSSGELESRKDGLRLVTRESVCQIALLRVKQRLLLARGSVEVREVRPLPRRVQLVLQPPRLGLVANLAGPLQQRRDDVSRHGPTPE